MIFEPRNRTLEGGPLGTVATLNNCTLMKYGGIDRRSLKCSLPEIFLEKGGYQVRQRNCFPLIFQRTIAFGKTPSDGLTPPAAGGLGFR